VTRIDYTLKIVNQTLGFVIFNYTHYEYLRMMDAQPAIGGQGGEISVPVRDFSGNPISENILEYSGLNIEDIYDYQYYPDVSDSKSNTQIATMQPKHLVVINLNPHSYEYYLSESQPKSDYEIYVIIGLIFLLFCAGIVIIRLLYQRKKCMADNMKSRAKSEPEIPNEFSNAGCSHGVNTDISNNEPKVTEEIVNVSKKPGNSQSGGKLAENSNSNNNAVALVPYNKNNDSHEIIELTPRKSSQATVKIVQNTEYTLEKEPGTGIVKTTKQEIKEYYPESAEPELLEEAKIVSKKLGTKLESEKISLKDTKVSLGIITEKTSDTAGPQTQSKYAALTNLENCIENGRFLKTFDNIELLGAGGFAEVHKARYILDGKYYAVKRIVIQHDLMEKVKKRKAYREIYAMQTFDHPYIVRYITCWIEIPLQADLLKNSAGMLTFGTPKKPSLENSIKYEKTDSVDAPKTSELGFEWERPENENDSSQISDSSKQSGLTNTRLEKQNSVFDTKKSNTIISQVSKYSMPKNTANLIFHIQMVLYPKTLKDYLLERGAEIDQKRNHKYFSQIISALQEIHSKNLIHRDMKPANIFLDSRDDVKVGDFGLAVKINEGCDSPLGDETGSSSTHTENAGTRQYLPPEQESGYYSEKVDIYATGLILMELCCNFTTGHEKTLAFERIRKARKLPEGLDFKKYREEASIIMKMTETDPEQRPSANEILNLVEYKEWTKKLTN